MPMQLSPKKLSSKPVLYQWGFDCENFPTPKMDQIETCVHSSASGTESKIKIPVHTAGKYKTLNDSV